MSDFMIWLSVSVACLGVTVTIGRRLRLLKDACAAAGLGAALMAVYAMDPLPANQAVEGPRASTSLVTLADDDPRVDGQKQPTPTPVREDKAGFPKPTKPAPAKNSKASATGVDAADKEKPNANPSGPRIALPASGETAPVPELEHPKKDEPEKPGPPKKEPPPQPKLEVEFFHTTAAAESVAFVVDRSGSMGGRRFERAREELKRSINRLDPGQEFYVVLFNHYPAPMFNESNPTSLAKASPSLKQRLIQWLDSVSPSGNTNPEQALQISAGLKPDVIYLLSDGQFSPLSAATMNLFRQHGIVVHTIAFESTSGASLLQDIAAQTNGTYRFVPVNAPSLNLDFAVRLSSENDARLRRIINGDPDRWDLALGSGLPAPSLMEELFELLRDPDPELRQNVRHVLALLSDGVDTELRPDASAVQRDEAVRQWQAWFAERAQQWFANRIRTMPSRQQASKTVQMMESPNRLERRGVATYLVSQSQRRTDLLMDLIADEDAEVRAVVKQTLVEMADGQDFGPPDDATEVQRAEAERKWRAWWDDRKLLDKLRLAKSLAEVRPQAARSRLEELIREHPDSEAAAQARNLLAELAQPPPPAPSNESLPGAEANPKPNEAEEQLAAKKLQFAQRIPEDNPNIIRKLLRDLIRRHPDTEAAHTARELLKTTIGETEADETPTSPSADGPSRDGS